ncbi:hypothetical protein HK101_001819 [Irineochytrium annulatum]|nr:hypothetical protein HK101_001819 [Irineochytrium annulatum]
MSPPTPTHIRTHAIHRASSLSDLGALRLRDAICTCPKVQSPLRAHRSFGDLLNIPDEDGMDEQPLAMVMEGRPSRFTVHEQGGVRDSGVEMGAGGMEMRDDGRATTTTTMTHEPCLRHPHATPAMQQQPPQQARKRSHRRTRSGGSSSSGSSGNVNALRRSLSEQSFRRALQLMMLEEEKEQRRKMEEEREERERIRRAREVDLDKDAEERDRPSQDPAPIDGMLALPTTSEEPALLHLMSPCVTPAIITQGMGGRVFAPLSPLSDDEEEDEDDDFSAIPLTAPAATSVPDVAPAAEPDVAPAPEAEAAEEEVEGLRVIETHLEEGEIVDVAPTTTLERKRTSQRIMAAFGIKRRGNRASAPPALTTNSVTVEATEESKPGCGGLWSSFWLRLKSKLGKRERRRKALVEEWRRERQMSVVSAGSVQIDGVEDGMEGAMLVGEYMALEGKGNGKVGTGVVVVVG